MHGGVETVNWIQCCKCGKWRVVDSNVSMEHISPTFICGDNTWAPQFSSCSIPEESHISDADFDGEANDVNVVASSLVNMSGGDTNTIYSGKRKPSLPPSSLNKLVISRKGRNRKDKKNASECAFAPESMNGVMNSLFIPSREILSVL